MFLFLLIHNARVCEKSKKAYVWDSRYTKKKLCKIECVDIGHFMSNRPERDPRFFFDDWYDAKSQKRP